MSYTAKDAMVDFEAILKEISIPDSSQIIENTREQGRVLRLYSGEEIVVFLSAIGYNSSANKRYFDARDSGAKQRLITYNYAKQNNLKYFYLGIRPELFTPDYIFSLESTEDKLQGTTGNTSNGRGEVGNQINFDRSFTPTKQFERITTKQGVHLSCIHKNSLGDYLSIFDNRELISFQSDEELSSDTSEQTSSNEPRPDLVQEIHFGAPGTGKSYSLAEIIRVSYPDFEDKEKDPDKDKYSSYVFRTTVHNEYSYFDFVGNVMPKSVEGKIDYTFEPGIFTQALNKALSEPKFDIYLIVEEMSRGNIASIFGDIFQLLDRDENGESEYQINNEMIYKALSDEAKVNGKLKEHKIKLPSNFHILGTANTSDQNVNVIDTAFKRRFGFVYEQVDAKPKIKKLDNGEVEVLKDEKGNVIYLNSFIFYLGDSNNKDNKFEWNEFYQKLNKFIVDGTSGLGLTEDKQLGQFFVKFQEESDKLSDDELYKKNFNSIKNKVLHYLWDDVQSVSMTDNKIFKIRDKDNKDGFSSFSELYKAFDTENSAENIFSVEFLTYYRNTELG